MEFDDIEDEPETCCISLAELVAEHNRIRSLIERRLERIPHSQVSAIHESVSGHFSKLRRALPNKSEGDAEIIRYTCNSPAVMAILNILTDMFK